jgi:flagellar biosynthesis/type III secretory pathway protein FliH
MQITRWKSRLLVSVASLLLVAPVHADAGEDQGRGRGRGRSQAAAARQGALARELPPGYHEPAFERGYDDGYDRGLADGKRGARYDPVDSRDYRGGDRGYVDAYGSRDAYRTNYRAGFRQGYEDGYRDGTR